MFVTRLMEHTQIEHKWDDEIVPFLGIQRKWANVSLKFYSFIFLGYTIWVVYQEFGDAAKPLKAKLTFLVSHLAAFSVFEAVTIVAFIQVWDIIMYLTNKFKANIEEIKAESIAIGRAEGRTETHQVWEEWYYRHENAKAQGLPFDDPPPSLNGDNTEQ